MLLAFSVLIEPRATVGAIDNTGGSAVKVVANGRFGVAFLGSITGSVGHMLTGLFETAFQVIPGVGGLALAAADARRRALGEGCQSSRVPVNR